MHPLIKYLICILICSFVAYVTATVGLKIEAQSVKITFWDLGGQRSLLLWDNYGIMYVIGSGAMDSEDGSLLYEITGFSLALPALSIRFRSFTSQTVEDNHV